MFLLFIVLFLAACGADPLPMSSVHIEPVNQVLETRDGGEPNCCECCLECSCCLSQEINPFLEEPDPSIFFDCDNMAVSQSSLCVGDVLEVYLPFEFIGEINALQIPFDRSLYLNVSVMLVKECYQDWTEDSINVLEVNDWLQFYPIEHELFNQGSEFTTFRMTNVYSSFEPNRPVSSPGEYFIMIYFRPQGQFLGTPVFEQNRNTAKWRNYFPSNMDGQACCIPVSISDC